MICLREPKGAFVLFAMIAAFLTLPGVAYSEMKHPADPLNDWRADGSEDPVVPEGIVYEIEIDCEGMGCSVDHIQVCKLDHTSHNGDDADPGYPAESESSTYDYYYDTGQYHDDPRHVHIAFFAAGKYQVTVYCQGPLGEWDQKVFTCDYYVYRADLSTANESDDTIYLAVNDGRTEGNEDPAAVPVLDNHTHLGGHRARSTDTDLCFATLILRGYNTIEDDIAGTWKMSLTQSDVLLWRDPQPLDEWLQSIDLDSPYGDRHMGQAVDFYLEGLNPKVLQIKAFVKPYDNNDWSEIDKDVKVMKMPLDIYYGLDGSVVSERLEEQQGSVSVANLNDTDGDGVADNVDDNIAGEKDMMKIILYSPEPWDGATEVTLTVDGDGTHVKLWKSEDKSAGRATAPYTHTFTAPGQTDTLWLEGLTPSATLRDTTVTATFTRGTVTIQDRANATFVWVANTARSPWITRQAADGFPHNPKPAPLGTDLPDLDTLPVYASIWTCLALDNSRYGHGPYAADSMIGGRKLREYSIMPLHSETLGVIFDCTRQVKVRWYTVTPGSGVLQPNGPMTRDWPWEGATPGHNEIPNDDNSTSDEQNAPTNGLLYDWDLPGTERTYNPYAFTIIRATFKEFVRVQFEWAYFLNQNGLREGTRASDKYDWHCFHYLRGNAAGSLEPDSALVSCSAPKKTGAGGGTCDVTLLAGADTQGFTALYNLANMTWTLTAQDPAGGPVTATLQGTQWTLTIANRVTVVITQAAPAFANGDKFEFSVFKTTATGGKNSETGTGYLDPTGGP